MANEQRVASVKDPTRRLSRVAKQFIEDLENAQHDAKFEKMLAAAERDGRLGGAFSCSICGTRYLSQEDAIACCAALDPMGGGRESSRRTIPEED